MDTAAMIPTRNCAQATFFDSGIIYLTHDLSQNDLAVEIHEFCDIRVFGSFHLFLRALENELPLLEPEEPGFSSSIVTVLIRIERISPWLVVIMRQQVPIQESMG